MNHEPRQNTAVADSADTGVQLPAGFQTTQLPEQHDPFRIDGKFEREPGTSIRAGPRRNNPIRVPGSVSFTTGGIEDACLEVHDHDGSKSSGTLEPRDSPAAAVDVRRAWPTRDPTNPRIRDARLARREP